MTRLLAITLLLAAPTLLAGCNFWRLYGDSVKELPTERFTAAGERVNLPVDVPTAAAAFADALPALGYSLSLREVHAGRATLVGQAGGQRAKINIRASDQGCHAVVSIGPLADAAARQQLIDAAESRLGLR